MKLSKLAHFVEMAIEKEPYWSVANLCGAYFQPYYQLMFLLSLQSDTGLRVELGVENGRGIVSMALGTSSRCIGFDNNLKQEAMDLDKRYSNLDVYHMSSLPVPHEIITTEKCIKLLHIDTEHSYSMAKAEFEAYQPYLMNEAIVLFDDLHAQENDVLRFFSELPYPKIQDDRLHPVCGYGVMVYYE